MTLNLNTEPKVVVFATGVNALLGAYCAGEASLPICPIAMATAIPTAASCLTSYLIYRVGKNQDWSPGSVGLFSLISSLFIFVITAVVCSSLGILGIPGIIGLVVMGLIMGGINLIRMTAKANDDLLEKTNLAKLDEVQQLNDQIVAKIRADSSLQFDMDQDLDTINTETNPRIKSMLIDGLIARMSAFLNS